MKILPRLAFLLMLPLAAHARTEVPLDAGWKFFQGDAQGAEQPGFDATSWKAVDVPHDWSIAGPFDQAAPAGGAGGWLPTGVAWYRKDITLPHEASDHVWLEFDGVMANNDVWLNGVHLGHRPSGYFSFRYEVTKQLKEGANSLVVKADTSAQPASRWYAGSGIYRHVRAVITGPMYVTPWSLAITIPEATPLEAVVSVQCTVANFTEQPAEGMIRQSILDSRDKAITKAERSFTIQRTANGDVTQKLTVKQPSLWSTESPHLYRLVTEVVLNGKVVDKVSTPFGIRTAKFTSNNGFLLNDNVVKLKGVCLHQDGGAVGVAVPLAVWERRLKTLKELGVNAIRTAHTPPAPGFLDLCDRMGFLVMDEFFDCWEKGKNAQDYHLYFDEWSQRDLREGILRDRNHPSVVLYSVGNEIHDTADAEKAKQILEGLVKVCHDTDPTRAVTQALFRPNATGDYKNGLADLLDVIGTNYRDKELLDAWKDQPTRKIIGTEQGHERATWLACRDNPQHSGQFLWAGIDYLGESRTWSLTVYNAGLLDRCGFIQPRGYERQSWWSDKPMVKLFRRAGKTTPTPQDPGYEVLEWDRKQVLFPDWNPVLAEAHTENVEVYSNAAEVELLLNGRSLGVKQTRKDAAPLNWEVPWEAGSLKAIARTGGKEVATDFVRTAGNPAKIALLADRKSIHTGFDDVANVEVQLLDGNDVIAPAASNLLQFDIRGPGEIIAVDSGNVTSTEPFQAKERKCYQGRALVIVRATGPGAITLTAKADGLAAKSLSLEGL